MGHRLKNMQSAWDTFNIPPPPVDNAAASSTSVDKPTHVDNAAASSTYVNKVGEETNLIDDILLKKLQSSIKKIDQDKYDETVSQWQGVNPGKKDAIKSGRFYPHMRDMDDEELETALINRDYNKK